MSDVGLFPPGAFLWLLSLGLLIVAGVTGLILMPIAYFRARREPRGILRQRLTGYAVGAFGCAAACGLTMWLMDSRVAPDLSHWADQVAVTYAWVALLICSGPAIGWQWNRNVRLGSGKSADH